MIRIACGFLPLLDSLLLVVAREQGFAAEQGIDLVLSRETSWANIRDRMAVGHFQVAHMLAPMPLAFNLGLSPLAMRVIAPMALGLGGNAVTVSNAVWSAMTQVGAVANLNPRINGDALARVIARRHAQQLPPLRFAVVHPHSVHNYELRYWLAACGIRPDTDLDIQIVPPPLMADAIAAGHLDAYCVGEPYNTSAVAAGSAYLATVKSAIWRSSPEKVLGVSANWASANPSALADLLRALYAAAVWTEARTQAGEFEALAKLLADDQYLATSPSKLLPALSGRLPVGDGSVFDVPDFFVPHARAATFPWISHATWIYSQMVRWGHVAHSAERAQIAAESFRPDIYRAALQGSGAAMPSANSKVEGALAEPSYVGASSGSICLGPDGFFDGRIFDPDQLTGYIESLGG